MATREAVERRRANRAAWRSVERQKRNERERHQAEVARRMVTRFFGIMPPHPLITLSYVYWQARRCGWDALSRYWSVDTIGKPCDPESGAAWQFWKAQHYRVREELVRLSTFRLIRRR